MAAFVAVRTRSNIAFGTFGTFGTVGTSPRVQEEGTCWAGGTTWQGQPAMRISISNWSTSETDVDESAV
jgi:hypothetical protein